MPRTLPYLLNTYKAIYGTWEPQTNKSKQKNKQTENPNNL